MKYILAPLFVPFHVPYEIYPSTSSCTFPVQMKVTIKQSSILVRKNANSRVLVHMILCYFLLLLNFIYVRPFTISTKMAVLFHFEAIIFCDEAYWTCLNSICVVLLDVDECASMDNLCSQDCYNTFGSYDCNCTEGYVLESDGYNCNGKYHKGR